MLKFAENLISRKEQQMGHKGKILHGIVCVMDEKLFQIEFRLVKEVDKEEKRQDNGIRGG